MGKLDFLITTVIYLMATIKNEVWLTYDRNNLWQKLQFQLWSYVDDYLYRDRNSYILYHPVS